jgi:hypothetical protein
LIAVWAGENLSRTESSAPRPVLSDGQGAAAPPRPIVTGPRPQGSSQGFRLVPHDGQRGLVLREPAEETAKGDRHELGPDC